MISKEHFEAHVRAEAQQKYPHLNIAADRLKRPGTAAISDAVALDRRDTYIAARMEHEWPLVEALQKLIALPSRGTRWAEWIHAETALHPYTKPT